MQRTEELRLEMRGNFLMTHKSSSIGEVVFLEQVDLGVLRFQMKQVLYSPRLMRHL